MAEVTRPEAVRVIKKVSVMRIDTLRKKKEQQGFQLGGGIWFHNKTEEQVFCDVIFYPKTALFLKDSTGKRKVTKDELLRDYHRLRT